VSNTVAAYSHPGIYTRTCEPRPVSIKSAISGLLRTQIGPAFALGFGAAGTISRRGKSRFRSPFGEIISG